MNKYTDIVFDWSGVINDNFETVYEVTQKIFDHFDVERITIEEFKREWVQPYMLFYEKYIPEIDHETEKKLYTKILLESEPTDVFPGMDILLSKLKAKNINLYILSSDSEKTFYPELKRFNIGNIFRHVALEVHDKREAIEAIYNQYKMKKNSTIFIGDTTHEVESGKKVGIATGAVTWGFQEEQALLNAGPDFIFKTVEQIEKELLKGSI